MLILGLRECSKMNESKQDGLVVIVCVVNFNLKSPVLHHFLVLNPGEKLQRIDRYLFLPKLQIPLFGEL